MRAGDRVVAVLTGHVLKDPGILVRMHQDAAFPSAPPNAPIEIEASVSAVAAVLADDARHRAMTAHD
jgi:threonine synthase